LEQYKANSLTLIGAVAMGTGVMIGAGIFALTGQVAELAGDQFPIAFLVAAIIVALSAYTCIKMSKAITSSGGIVMYLKRHMGQE
jgi:amino acid transporter